MRLVHNHNQVFLLGEIVEITVADCLVQAANARNRTLLVVFCELAAVAGGNFCDVENVYYDIRNHVVARADSAFVVVAGNDNRGIPRKFAYSLEDIFGRVGREVGLKLVVNCKVGGYHKEIVYAVHRVQIRNESSHQTRFADARCKRKTKRRKLALEIRNCWKFAFDNLQRLGNVAVFRQIRNLANSVEN